MKSRDSLTADVKAIAEEIDSILHSTGINGNNVFADALASFGVGGATGALGINIGEKLDLTATNQAVIDDLKAGDADTLGTSIGSLFTAVSDALGYVGNNMQVLESKQEYLTSAIANNTATISRLFDADMAMEQLNATKGQIGTQIGTAMLATLNAAPQNILSLFR